MSRSVNPAARRAGLAVLAAIALAVVAPVAFWFDDRLIALALMGQGVMVATISPFLRTVGIATTLAPSLCLGWGLFGLLPALRPIGRGEVAPRVGAALHRLGLSVLLVGLYEPVGRAILLAALTLAPGRLAIEVGISTHAVLLVALGATLMALGPVLRGAAAALEENRGFV